ncbi:MAG: DUF2336 domain-containing protein, partial [Pseudomonadota bacterium]
MADGALDTTQQSPALARGLLLRRLIDVVALPASRAGVQDRAIAGDLLLELLIDSDETSRELCARRLAALAEAPRRVLRFLASDIPEVSGRILRDSKGLDASDLSSIARAGAPHHRLAIASRRDLGPCVSDAIAESGDIVAMLRMLENRDAEISDRSMDKLVSESRESPELVPLLLGRG